MFLFWDEWTDPEQAESLKEEIDFDDENTWKQGARYSVIYEFCGFTFLALTLSYLCLSAGTVHLGARLAGLAMLCLFSCLNFTALITTAVFRFNSMGKLAALSKCPSRFDSGA